VVDSTGSPEETADAVDGRLPDALGLRPPRTGTC
jgi:hypothetical protein